MRKIIILILAFVVLTFPVATFATKSINEEESFNGAVFSKNSYDELIEEYSLKNVKVKISENTILGSLRIGNKKADFSANKIKDKDKDGVNYYNGNFNVDNINFKCDIIKNNDGLSILYYDDNKNYVRSIVLTSLDADMDSIKNKINKEVAPVVNNKDLIIEENEEILSGDISTRSYPINHVHHMFKDATYIPLVVDGGTVEGWFHYQTNVDPSAEFYAVYMDAIINWATGFDGVTITNVDEVYGIFWGTPSCPTKNLQTFTIGMMAEKQSPYKMKATVSYYLLVGKIPVLYWSTDEEYLSY